MSDTPSFVHLRAHTEYSINESILRVEDLIAKAKADGQPACAITDPNAMFGAIRFYTKAKSSGLKPILGADVTIQGNGPDDPSHQVLLLSKNYEGYKNLLALLSRGYSQNMQKGGVPMIREEWLAESGADLICLSGTETGLVGSLACSGEFESAKAVVERYKNLFPGRYFLEIQRRGGPLEEAFVSGIAQIADQTQTPLVATHPMQFLEQDDFVSHEIKVCDKRKPVQILHDANRERSFTPEQHFKTTAQMQNLFSDFPDALDNTVAIAQMCSLDIPLGKSILPPFPPPDGLSVEDYLAQLSREGLNQRLEKLYPDTVLREQKRPDYEARLQMELDVIKGMGFVGYFLIVADFIGWAHDHDIPVGPGRGSGAGSLVAYSLRITDLDPLAYDLLFERFLNPERVSMPDFDIDFCQYKRELVVDYVSQKYGRDSVSGISTITTLGAKNAVRATGRALGMHNSFVDGISKLILTQAGQEMTIDKALDQEETLQSRYNSEPDVQRLLDYARRLEGLPHSIGQHAAGLVIAPGKISDFSPLYVTEDKVQPVSQYDKDDVEKTGLVKFDFLGLTTLTEIDYAVKLLQQEELTHNFDISSIPLDDEKTLQCFAQGDTVSVFQFESDGMQGLLKKARPDCLDDLIALNALYRPGPMDLIPTYIRCKHGEEPVIFLDPRLEPILAPTYGVMVYQEQVMQIAQVIGGYSLGGADILRRAMGKKKAEEMAKHRAIFVSGAEKKGVDNQTAGKLYDMMEKFAGYGFNKSHAAAYSLVAYQTGYLKVHHPAAFYAAMLTIEGQKDTANIPPLIKDASTHNITIVPPHINRSIATFVPVRGEPDALSYGFAGIKGVGSDAAEFVVNIRKEKGDFTSLLDFCKKIGTGASINKKGIEQLIKAGAFDALHPNRAECLEILPKYLKYTKDLVGQAELNPMVDMACGELFGADAKPSVATKKRKTKKSEPLVEPEWPILPAQSELEMLGAEKSAYGFYFSGNPYNTFNQHLGGSKGCLSLSAAQNLSADGQQHWISGMIESVKTIQVRNGKMAFVTIGDGSATLEIKVFNDLLEVGKDFLKPDHFVMFAAEAKEDTYKGGTAFLGTKILDFEHAVILMAEKIQVSLPPEDLPWLQELCLDKPGSTQVVVWHPTGGEPSHVRCKSHVFMVNPDQAFLDTLTTKYGANYVKLGFRDELEKPPIKKKAWTKRS